MTRERPQLTRAQLTAMYLLGLSTWAIIIGVIYAIVQTFFVGCVIAATGLCCAGLLLCWLYWVGKDRDRN